MKPSFRVLLSSLLILPAALVAQNDAPVVHTLAPALQPKVQFLNPEYLVYAPSESSNAKLPLLIFLHGAGGGPWHQARQPLITFLPTSTTSPDSIKMISSEAVAHSTTQAIRPSVPRQVWVGDVQVFASAVAAGK